MKEIRRHLEESFNKYFPGYLTESKSRVPLVDDQPKLKLDCSCYNREYKRYERIALRLCFNGNNEILFSMFCAISVLPRPEFETKECLSWMADVMHLAQNAGIDDFFERTYFNLGNKLVFSKNVDRLFQTVSPLITTVFDVEWNRILTLNPNVEKVISALDDIRRNYKTVLYKPEVVDLEDIENAFLENGLPLNETIFFNDDNLDKLLYSDPKKFKILARARISELKKIGFGFVNLRDYVLYSFGRLFPNRPNPLFSEIAGRLSESGDLKGCGPELEELSEMLTNQQVLELYSILEKESNRWEAEWRSEFVRFFPYTSDLLPPRKWTSVDLRDSIRANDIEGVKEIIRYTGILTKEYDPILIYQKGLVDAFYECPFLVDEEDGITPIGLAIRLEHYEIANYLKQVIKNC